MLEQLTTAENFFGLLGLVCVVLAVAKLAGTFWAVLLLGALLFYMAWVAHTEESSAERLEREQADLVTTAVHEALHAARLDKEAMVGAVAAEAARAIDQILTEERRTQLKAA
jgi:flagellar biosynthesis component FlhA